MTKMHSDPEARAITATVLIDAPRETVWKASNEPEYIRRWWGCAEMAMPVCDVDLREGGAYRFVGRMPDGEEVPMKGVYKEVAAPERVVHTQIYDVEPFSQHEALVTVTLEDKEGKTELRSQIVFPSREVYEGAASTGMAQGMGLAIDRLAKLALQIDQADRELTITRLVDATPEQLYAGWTQPELVKQWFTPAPWTTPDCEIDLWPGGRFRFLMQDPDGAQYDNDGVLLEVVENEKVVFTDAFLPGWVPKPNPFMVGIVTFAKEGGKTRYTAVARHWSVEKKKEHEAMGFHGGWNKALDQLLELIAK